MIVLDTNVLAYAVGRDHPLKPLCRRLVVAIENGQLDATTTTEVIQEFLHIRSRSRNREDAVRTATDFVNMLAPLIVTDEEDLRAGLRLFERHERLNAFDSVLAAAAIARDAEVLVSADVGFRSIPRLNHITPGTDRFEALFPAP